LNFNDLIFQTVEDGFNTAASPKMSSIHAYLSTIAERAGIAFFSQEKATAAGNSGFR
jgi:hypothetical protein